MVHNAVETLEKKVADFFNSPYSLATSSCTHAIELSLKYLNLEKPIGCPKKTYHSVPFALMRNNLSWYWVDNDWKNWYYLENTAIIDAAPLWKENSYIAGSIMCLSFNLNKPLNVGKGGMILTDSLDTYKNLKEMCYEPVHKDLDSIGYHFYMDKETAQIGLNQFDNAIIDNHKEWNYKLYPDLSLLEVFNQ